MCKGLAYIAAVTQQALHSPELGFTAAHRSPSGLSDSARRGKISMGWFYGFKLHAIINARSELIRLRLTAGNVDNRQPMETLARQNLQLITPSGKT